MSLDLLSTGYSTTNVMDLLTDRMLALEAASLNAPQGSLRKLALILEKDDHVGLSFWLVTGLMLASTAFFFFQVFLVPRRWANSMIVCGLVTGVAWHHYLYMKDIWAETKRAPTIYRYMDWLITVPLQVVEFYLVLSAASPVDKPLASSMFFRLMFASILMLVFGYMGETEVMERWVAFCGGLFMWIFINYEVWFGEASRTSGKLSLDEAKKFLARFNKDDSDSDASDSDDEKDPNNDQAKQKLEGRGVLSMSDNTNDKDTTDMNGVVVSKEILNSNSDADRQREFRKPEAQIAFELLRAIVLIGWSLYPVGYVLGGIETDNAEDALNAVYNVADLINKVAFGLAIFYAAGSQNEIEKQLIVTSRVPSIEQLLSRKGGTLDLVSRSLQIKLGQRANNSHRRGSNLTSGTGASSANTYGTATSTSYNASNTASGAQTPTGDAAQQQASMMGGVEVPTLLTGGPGRNTNYMMSSAMKTGGGSGIGGGLGGLGFNSQINMSNRGSAVNATPPILKNASGYSNVNVNMGISPQSQSGMNVVPMANLSSLSPNSQQVAQINAQAAALQNQQILLQNQMSQIAANQQQLPGSQMSLADQIQQQSQQKQDANSLTPQTGISAMNANFSQGSGVQGPLDYSTMNRAQTPPLSVGPVQQQPQFGL